MIKVCFNMTYNLINSAVPTLPPGRVRQYALPTVEDKRMRYSAFNLFNSINSLSLVCRFAALCLASLVPLASTGAVLINEVMYHPNSTNVLEEWVELYNPGPTNV